MIFPCLIAVAINLIVQHIQDILNGDLCKRHRGGPNGRNYKRTFLKESTLECWPLASAHTWSLAAGPTETSICRFPHRPMIKGLGLGTTTCS